MNRVRMGMTGLAFVFLVVLIAAASLQPVRTGGEAKPPEETLATLGVAPGAEDAGQDRAEEAAPPTVLETAPLDDPQRDVEPLVIDEDEALTEI